jgi:ribonuclease Z
MFNNTSSQTVLTMMVMIRNLSILLLCILISVTVAATSPIPEKNEIKLTFLGTGSPRPSTSRYGPSILVEAGEFKLLVDAGPGLRERLFEAGGFELLTSVDKVILTHLHFDHTISLSGLWLTGWLYGRRVPFEVYGPLGTESMMAHFEKAYAWDMKYRRIIGVPQKGSEIRAFDVKPGEIFQKNGLKITAFPVQHMPVDPDTGVLLDLEGQTFGFRIDYYDRSVVFSGDTRSTPNSQLLKYGENVDVLVHEVEVPSSTSVSSISQTVHSTPEQAAFIFAKTKPRMAVYTHNKESRFARLTHLGPAGRLLLLCLPKRKQQI